MISLVVLIILHVRHGLLHGEHPGGRIMVTGDNVECTRWSLREGPLLYAATNLSLLKKSLLADVSNTCLLW